jgi:hypothetical protein
MSAVRLAEAISVGKGEYPPWEVEIEDIAVLESIVEQPKTLDRGTVCLLVLGVAPLLAGAISGNWPVALAALGPWLLAWLDVAERKRIMKRKAK